MLFKVLNCDKVKVLVEKDDIKNFENINFEINCEDTKNAIALLLVGVYEQTGLNFLSSRVLIESVRGNNNSYYVVITRLTNQNKQCDNDEVDMYLFRLNYIEDVIDISRFLKTKKIELKYSSLYKYRNNLYLCLYFTPESISDKQFDRIIDEISDIYPRCKWNILNDVILKEWGILVCDNLVQNVTAAV